MFSPLFFYSFHVCYLCVSHVVYYMTDVVLCLHLIHPTQHPVEKLVLRSESCKFFFAKRKGW